MYSDAALLLKVMGWATWNAFHRHFTEQVFYDAADLMAKNGMQAAGYEYINVVRYLVDHVAPDSRMFLTYGRAQDAGWWNNTTPAKGQKRTIYRNASGFPSWDPVKYPRGLPALIDYLHMKGFKYGHYTDAGTGACDHESGMSEGFERQDSQLFAEWKVDMLKIDSCAVHETNQTVIARWKQEIIAAGRPMVFSNCHNGCANDPFMIHDPNAYGWADWCWNDTNSWRTSRDIEPSWQHVMFNLHTLIGIGERGKPGQWNDPDFMELDAMHSINAQRAHFSMWCITSVRLPLDHSIATRHVPLPCSACYAY